MIGGGPGAFIGDVHRKALNFDGLARLVAGCFSATYENTLTTGAELGLAADRLYRTFEEMAAKEAERTDKIDFVVIVTPNHTHYPVARAFLEKGIHVVCDKPLTLETAQGEELKSMAEDRGCLFCVTYTYTGYPTVKHAREMIAEAKSAISGSSTSNTSRNGWPLPWKRKTTSRPPGGRTRPEPVWPIPWVTSAAMPKT